MFFSPNKLTLALAGLTAITSAHAAGLDRSGQDVTAFLQDGTYAEVSYTYIDGDVTGHDNANLGVTDLNAYTKGNKIDDIAEAYDFMRYGVKADINDTVSVGILYDEPWGAAAEYEGNNNFVSDATTIDSIVSGVSGGSLPNVATAQAVLPQLTQGAQQAAAAAQQAAAAGNTAQAQELAAQAQSLAAQAQSVGSSLAIAQGLATTDGESTNVDVHSENITGLIGVKLGDNFQVYGGPAFQRLEGDVALRGPAYLTSAGYDAHMSKDESVGWVAGAAFMKPEIALRAALTYRSEIDHENNIDERLPALDPTQTFSGDFEITTPESFNFDFQTGINPTTLATAKVRYVPWSDFAIVPPYYNAASKRTTQDDVGLPLVSYDDDQWQVELGLAKRLSPAVAVSGSLGWDSGAGNPTTSLGPIEGYYSVGAGAKLNMTENWALSAGGKYLMFGDAKGSIPNNKVVSNFEDNDGYVLGVKLSYQD